MAPDKPHGSKPQAMDAACRFLTVAIASATATAACWYEAQHKPEQRHGAPAMTSREQTGFCLDGTCGDAGSEGLIGSCLTCLLISSWLSFRFGRVH
jgi:hypothetical protein